MILTIIKALLIVLTAYNNVHADLRAPAEPPRAPTSEERILALEHQVEELKQGSH